MVGCTQPRRVAAMSVATRVAEEMDVQVFIKYRVTFLAWGFSPLRTLNPRAHDTITFPVCGIVG